MEYKYEIICKKCGPLARFKFLYDARQYVGMFAATFSTKFHNLSVREVE